MRDIFRAARHCALAIQPNGFTDTVSWQFYPYEQVPMELYLALPEMWPTAWLLNLAETVSRLPNMQRTAAMLYSVYCTAPESNATLMGDVPPDFGLFAGGIARQLPHTLQERLDAALQREDYEEAARLRDIIQKEESNGI